MTAALLRGPSSKGRRAFENARLLLLGHASCLEVSSVQHFKEELHLSWAPQLRRGLTSQTEMSQVWGTAGCWMDSQTPAQLPRQGCLGSSSCEPSGSQVSRGCVNYPSGRAGALHRASVLQKPSFCPVERTVPFSLGQERTKPATFLQRK